MAVLPGWDLYNWDEEVARGACHSTCGTTTGAIGKVSGRDLSCRVGEGSYAEDRKGRAKLSSCPSGSVR
jgi:hypothetical protein